MSKNVLTQNLVQLCRKQDVLPNSIFRSCDSETVQGFSGNRMRCQTRHSRFLLPVLAAFLITQFLFRPVLALSPFK